MPEPVTVWMVQLAAGSTADVEGTLRLDDEALVFEHAAKPAELRFPYRGITKVRRILSSPVLVVQWADGSEPRRTAFYFVQPPPLDPPSPEEVARSPDRPRSPLAQRRASSRRRHTRANMGYLAMGARGTKSAVQAWTGELKARVRDAHA